jgi:MFS family permease
MAAVFWGMVISGIALVLPLSPGVWAFTLALFVLGAGMGIGKASVYKMIPDHFPREVGSVGGLVGALGALGGVLLPLAWAAIPGSTFAALLALTVVSASWFAVDGFLTRKPAEAPATWAKAEEVVPVEVGHSPTRVADLHPQQQPPSGGCSSSASTSARGSSQLHQQTVHGGYGLFIHPDAGHWPIGR